MLPRGWGSHPGPVSKLLRRAGEGPAPCSRQASVSLQDHGEGLSTAPPFPCVTLSLVLPTPAGKPGPAAPHLHTSSSSPHPLLIRSPIRSLQAPWSTISRVLRDLTPDRIPLLPTASPSSPSPPPSSSRHGPRPRCVYLSVRVGPPWTICTGKMWAAPCGLLPSS